MGIFGSRPWLCTDLTRLRKLCAHAPALSWSQIAHLMDRTMSDCHKYARLSGVDKPPCRPREPWKDVAA